METGKYIEIWEEVLPYINEAIEKGGDTIELNGEVFKECGDRINSGYGFRLDIVNAQVPRKDGSAVARDLKEVLDGDRKFKNLSHNKQITIRMGKAFDLQIIVR